MTCEMAEFFALKILELLQTKYALQNEVRGGDSSSLRLCKALGLGVIAEKLEEKKPIGTPVSPDKNCSDDLDRDDREASELDFSESVEHSENEQLAIQIPALVKQRYCTMISKMPLSRERRIKLWLPNAMQKNLATLRNLLGINEVEEDVLILVYLMHYDMGLYSCAEFLQGAATRKINEYLATILGYRKDQIRVALDPQSILARSGLIETSYHHRANLIFALSPLNEHFLDNFIEYKNTDFRLFETEWKKAPDSTLNWSHYSHLEPMATALKSFVCQSTRKPGLGGNILIYGPPGTGKTELSRLLGNTAKAVVYEVGHQDKSGSALSSENRLAAMKSAQSLLKTQKAIIVFDEADDIFSTEDDSDLFGVKSRQTKISKAHINKLLEESTVPTIWISNQTELMDRAFLRRYDMILQVPNLPVKQRELHLKNLMGDQVDSSTIRRIVSHPGVTPAILSRTAQVVARVKKPGKDVSVLFENLIEQSLVAQSFEKPLTREAQRQTNIAFDPHLVNCSTPLYSMVKNMRPDSNARILISGPPGTGKTACGRWIAEEIGAPILVKKASDLLGMYIGKTEQNIAKTFSEARRSQSVLMIDEIESFIQPRQDAHRSWEVTQVNEMLTQMESFEGILIGSTNFSGSLDEASFRRFDLKLKFDYLSHAQLVVLINRQLFVLGLSHEDNFDFLPESLHEKAACLSRCTPGDISAIARQHLFNPITDVDDFISRLRVDLDIRHRNTRPIGFLS